MFFRRLRPQRRRLLDDSERKRPRKPAPRTSAPSEREPEPSKPTRKPIVVDGNDPLSGLE